MTRLDGKTALITGAARGLGRETAIELAQRGARVYIADRNREAGLALAHDLADQGLSADFVALDLADLAAVTKTAETLLGRLHQLDILINNAGLLPPHVRTTTHDGFELALGISFYGHFALTAQLLPLLLAAPAARVVTLSSIAHAGAVLDTEDPKGLRDYDATRAYARSKLAGLLFARELQAQSQAAGAAVISVAAHPGIARTPIGSNWEQHPSRNWRGRLAQAAMHFAMRYLGQDARAGAQPIILAASTAQPSPGGFYGPAGLRQFRGPAVEVKPHRRTLARHDAAQWWRIAEAQTGLSYRWA